MEQHAGTWRLQGVSQTEEVSFAGLNPIGKNMEEGEPNDGLTKNGCLDVKQPGPCPKGRRTTK